MTPGLEVRTGLPVEGLRRPFTGFVKKTHRDGNLSKKLPSPGSARGEFVTPKWEGEK